MKSVFILVILFSLLTTIFCPEPALKINLNPPEENVKDTIGKLFNNSRGLERYR
jgi:hypothetical protein